MQGVTTEIVGNCGYLVAPVRENKDLLKEYITPLMGIKNVEIDWESIKEYLLLLKNQGVGINVASLVGQGTIRIAGERLNSKMSQKIKLIATVTLTLPLPVKELSPSR